jgi:hypothetical protein
VPILAPIRAALVTLVALLCLVAGGAPAPLAARVVEGVRYGITANTQTQSDIGLLHDRVATTGVTWLREDLKWSVVQPTASSWDWSRYDALYSAAATRGLHVLPVIDSTPSWLAAQPMTLPPPGAYAAFVSAVVARYGPHGSFWAAHSELPSVPSQWFELWNEPWIDRPALPVANPPAYAELVRATVQAGRAIDPDARFLLEADSRRMPSGQRWTEALFAAMPDLAQWFDGVAVHPYGDAFTDPNSRFVLTMEGVHSTMERHGAVDKPFWVTEFGYSTCPALVSGCVTEAVQAQNYEQALSRFTTTYASYVLAIFAYHYTDQGGTSSPSDPEKWYGITRSDETPKAAFDVLHRFAIGPRAAR